MSAPRSPYMPTLLALAALFLLTPLSRADLPSEREALPGRMEAFALWCEESQLLAERNRTFELLIELVPDHETARTSLGYRAQRDGTWKAPGRTKPMKDNEEALAQLAAELVERRRAVVQPYRDAALAMSAEDEADARERALELVLRIDPDDPEIHQLRGEERYGNAWVLAETARAYDRRPELRRIIADSIRRSGAPDVLSSNEDESRLGVEWTANARTPDVQVFGTGMLEESLRAAQAAQAAGDVFRRVFEADTRYTRDFTVYLLSQSADREPFIDALPEVTPDERAFLKQLVGSGIPHTANTAQWAPSIARRLDGTVRHTLGMFLLAEFDITTNAAWAWEGVGLYLTRELVGTRLTWYIAGSDEDTELARLRADLLVQEANWMNAAWKLLRGPRAPDLGEVMRQDTGAMGIDGMLASYALCAYLLESRPRELIELLFRAGRNEDPADAVRQALDMSLDELRERLERWLSERRRPEYYGA